MGNKTSETARWQVIREVVDITIAILFVALFAGLCILGTSCASGPLCQGTEDEVKQCQEHMARARENRFNGFGNRR
jgi:hypothetical protein